MNDNFAHTIQRMNELGRSRQPFAFLFDFDLKKTLVFRWDDDVIRWSVPEHSNTGQRPTIPKKLVWETEPVPYLSYKKAFDLVQSHIYKGDSYLLNLTMPAKVTTNYTLQEIFWASQSQYKVYLENCFVCFSPEIFVRIANGKISSFPMKGTIDADLPNAAEILRTDKKEVAEHSTIVDLIRNDLSMVADHVTVKRFCYLDRIKSSQAGLLQMSSEISGTLPSDYYKHLGDIFARLLPAGSISGAPKKKTIEIIKKAENYSRGYYTGIFGIFDGTDVDSCVLIRFIEQEQGQLIYKSGGGITYQSNCEKEYDELIKKIYVPLAGND